MKKLLLPLFLFGFLISPSVKAETILYCQEEISIGLMKKEGNWQEQNFALERIMMKFEDDFSNVIIDGEMYSCFNGGEFKNYNPIICKSTIPYHSFTLNIDKKSLRYVWTQISIGGYASILDNDPDTDNILAGKCEKF